MVLRRRLVSCLGSFASSARGAFVAGGPDQRFHRCLHGCRSALGDQAAKLQIGDLAGNPAARLLGVRPAGWFGSWCACFWGERLEELQGLGLKPHFVQIEQALDRIGPENAVGVGFGKAVGIPQQMDHQAGRLLTCRGFQSRIKLAKEPDVRVAATKVKGQIEPRRADQIQCRMQSPCSKHSGDGDAFGMELLESGNQGVHGSWLAQRSEAKASRSHCLME